MANEPAGLDELLASPDPAAAPASAPDAPGEPPGLNEFLAPELNQAKYGGLGQQALTGLEGLAHGALGPVATGLEAAASKAGIPGLMPADQVGRQEVNPWTHGLTEAGGLIAPALVTGGLSALERAGLEVPEAIATGAEGLASLTQGPLLGHVGEAAGAAAAKLGGPAILNKIGSSAVRGAVDFGLLQASDETSKLINGEDPNLAVQTALPHLGLAATLGGILGGGGGAISSLWRATVGSKAGALLNAISEHAGGIEGVESNPVTELVSKTGMSIAPELQAGLENDPAVREMFHTLTQSDTTASGRAIQDTKKTFDQQAGETLSQSLGRDPGQIPDEFDKYTHGKTIGTTLADEVQARVEPVKEAYEGFAKKFAGKELEPSIAAKAEDSQKAIQDANDVLTKVTKKAVKIQAGGDPGASIEALGKVEDAQLALDAAQRAASAPGTADVLSQKIGQLAMDQRWTLAPDDEIMKAVNSVQKDLANPELKTLSDLSEYTKRIDEKLPFDPMKGARNRAAGMIKGVLRDAEGELIASHIGSEEGSEALEAYRSTQAKYAAESKIKGELEDRLGRLGSTSSYASRIRGMAQTDGEGIFRKLSGANDADALRLLQEHFQKTASAVREAHLDQLLSKAKIGDALIPGKILGGLDKLSPQLRSLIVPEASAARVEAIGQVLDQLKDAHYNYSNTGRTLDKLFQYVPGSAVGMISMLMGHNPAIGLLLGGLTKTLSKDAPDAVRLGLLKWMGSNKPVEAGAFKAMVNFIQSTQKGASLMTRASKAIFSPAARVLPEHLMPSENNVYQLDRKLKQIQSNPGALEKVADNTGYYLPDHGIAITSTATNAANYLNSLRPTPIKQSPLDPEIEPSESQKSDFNRTLSLAEQPLMLAHYLSEGTLTATDVAHVKALYSGFYNQFSQKITESLMDHLSKGETVPYEMRQGLSTILGQPMDSSFIPQNILSNQAAFSQVNQQAQAKAQMGKSTPSQVGMREMKVANRFSLNPSDDEA